MQAKSLRQSPSKVSPATRRITRINHPEAHILARLQPGNQGLELLQAGDRLPVDFGDDHARSQSGLIGKRPRLNLGYQDTMEPLAGQGPWDRCLHFEKWAVPHKASPGRQW
jgi:hypothetical protein